MRYSGHTKVLIPWYDTEGMKNWMLLSFIGDVDRRRVLAEIRKTVKKQLGRSISKKWIKENVMIVPNSADTVQTDEMSAAELRAKTEAFIQRMESDADNEGTNPEDQSSLDETAEGEMRSMPPRPETSGAI